MSTSQDGQELHADDGDDRVGGPSEYDTRHAVRERRRGGWLKHPEPDFGPSDLASRGDIDRRGNRTPWPRGAGYTPQGDPRGPGASYARARRSSAHEYWDARWYGDPAKRQD
jgi:hypothetical protein